MHDVALLYDDRFLKHTPPQGHPERPARLEAVTRQLRASGVWDLVLHLSTGPATEAQLLAVHSATHVNSIRRICASGGGVLDEGDTHAAMESFDAACLAAGAVTTAVDAVLEGRTHSAFCAIRPPGHHAEADRPMGFCLFNNAAIGARHAQNLHGIERVAILDWDVHHGNGTQHIFEEDPSVLYISLHQFPFYPGTGARGERGTGPGKGYTLNIPLPAGTGEDRYLRAFHEEVLPALDNHQPGLLIISAGFDAHRDDPLGGMKLTEQSFAAMTHLVTSVAPIVSVLEGGYDLHGLARSVEQHIRALGSPG